jgi:hypothetical protein
VVEVSSAEAIMNDAEFRRSPKALDTIVLDTQVMSFNMTSISALIHG